MCKISVIVPTYNEKENISKLISRLHNTFYRNNTEYELIFIDDYSNDNTRKEIRKFIGKGYPVRLFLKRGKKGKAFSLLEGFKKAKYDVVGMIDADLQYPPEAIPEMAEKLNKFDIVVANRLEMQDISLKRKITTRGFRFVFVKLLFNLNCDAQSGLKVFKKEILNYVQIDNVTPWTFDLQFLYKALNFGYSVGNFDIRFDERKDCGVKLNFLSSIFEIGFQALKLRLASRDAVCFCNDDESKMKGDGVCYLGNKFVTHTNLDSHYSAVETVVRYQKFVLASIILIIAAGFVFNWHATAILIVAALTIFYFSDLFFNLFLIIRSFQKSPEIKITDEEIKNLEEKDLPVYTIFCPLYKEWRIIPQFIEAISKIDWPKDKLDVHLLLEEDDKKTIEAVEKINLPNFFRPIIVPHSMPKTKPKACNYGLAHAKGEYAVIYDAEDIPDPKQLKKAFLAFQKPENKNIVCMQAKLNFYNTHQNILTRIFTAEYSLWFDLVLTGLQSIKAPIPLGGTSNHFKTKDLHLLKGWDPFNVTEDCDLGMRLCKKGYNTAIFDSTTMEEANSDLKNWIRQRSRWVKGYIQTYLVHMRDPREFISGWKNPHVLTFQLVVGGKIASMFINPFMWLITISYFSFPLIVGPTIESLYPPIIFYMAVFCLVFGNFLYLYYYMIGCAKREQWDIIKYIVFVPVYWLMMSVAAYKALFQIFFKPHYWEKTNHGLHLATVEES